MRVWSVANQKGGVGKTTTAISIAGLLAQRELRVLLVDLDPQGSLSLYLGVDPDSVEYSLFSPPPVVADLITTTDFENLSLLPASTSLAVLERQIAKSGKGGALGLTLKRALNLFADQFDMVIVDSPPQLGVLMINAITASEQLILPVQTEFLALNGLQRMYRTLTMLTASRPQKLATVIVPNLYDQRTSSSLVCLRQLRHDYGDDLAKTVVPVDAKIREASKLGKPVSWCFPRCRAAVAYTRIIEQLL